MESSESKKRTEETLKLLDQVRSVEATPFLETRILAAWQRAQEITRPTLPVWVRPVLISTVSALVGVNVAVWVTLPSAQPAEDSTAWEQSIATELGISDESDNTFNW